MPARNDSNDTLHNDDVYAPYPHYNQRVNNFQSNLDGFKLVIMGSVGVGKTSLVRRYTENKWNPAGTASTTGAFFVTHKTDFKGTRVKLQIWDTAGQERFRSMAPIYYRGANAAIIMYDLTRLESFEDVRMWLEELRKNADFPELAVYIVGSKADLRAQRQVTPDRARQALHRWFPPPRRPSPPPTPIPTTSHSLASYIRPRFTSITSYGAPSSGSSSGSAHPTTTTTTTTTTTNLARANTTGGLTGLPPSSRPNGARHNSLHSVDATPSKALLRGARPKTHQREKSWAGAGHPPNNLAAFSFPNLLGASKPEWDPQEAEEDSLEGGEEPEWGLGTNMHLFEVSAKDSSGIQELFDTVIAELLERRHEIIAARRERERDSVMLHNTSWGALAEEEEAKARDQRQGWGCC